MKYILGIDPGLSGALAFYDPMLEELITIPMPTLAAGTGSKRIIDEYKLAAIIDDNAEMTKKCVIEQVGAMPGQGVTSMFNFGMSYGILRGIVSANFIPVEHVRPQKWKKALRVPSNKDSARARASEIFPKFSDNWNLAKWDGRAEAALIAYYGATLS